jgi:hypothetical protein
MGSLSHGRVRLAALAALLACAAGCGNDSAVGEPVDRPPTAFDASYRAGWRIGCRRASAILAARQADVLSCSRAPGAGAALEDTAEPGDAYELGIAEACAKFLDPPEYDRCLTQRRPNE